MKLKLGPVTKLDKRNKTKSRKFDDDVMSKKNLTSLTFFQFRANLEQSGSRNADISKFKRALILKGIFFDTSYGCVLTCQVSSF